jgi:outer membrane receptor protein involved in Fe transport
MTWRLGAQNLLDRQPPISPGYSNNRSNTDAQVYDSLGRYFYTSVTLDF